MILQKVKRKQRRRKQRNKTNLFNSADIISAVEFDHTGDYLATGDKGGRVVLFERNDGVKYYLTRLKKYPINNYKEKRM
jgi:hypothetical protein